MPRSESMRALLRRNGFDDADRAATLLADDVLAPVRDALGERELVASLGRTADPDQGLLGLLRVIEAATLEQATVLTDALADPVRRSRVLAGLGASSAVVDDLVKHPEHVTALADARRRDGDELRDLLVDAVRGLGAGESDALAGSGGAHPAYDALRVAYRRQLLSIAALDLTSPDPAGSMPDTARSLAELAEAALEAALVIAREQVGDDADTCRLAVIGMGKTGGGELNYISDVDVIFVGEPADGANEDVALAVGTRVATNLMKACATPTAEGSLWPVDAALRPEGKAGPLVRTVASHRNYYERWAKTWEFQALLKASVAAGDREVGERYLDAVRPMVWQAAGRPNFVEDAQAMRRRVEQHVPKAEAARQLKLGPGGLRDVEFSVQLLQLVHGRSDESLRDSATLPALAALSAGGYVGREDAAQLDRAYRTLRSLEHRIQLARLRRTHLMPTSPTDLRRLGRSMGHRSDPAREVVADRQAVAREVRRIHEKLFYRPLLAAAARLSPEEAGLSPEAARDRLAALGFRDPAGAMRHLESLTAGVSRRAAIQRQLLPVMLGWFADEADPDAGLLAFRKVSDALGSTHWYLKMLRDEGRAADRLAHVLARSRYVADMLEHAPESVAIFGDDGALRPRTRDELVASMRTAAARKDTAEQAIAVLRGLRRAELLRIAVADLVGRLDVVQVGDALTDLSDAVVEVALEAVTRERAGRVGRDVACDLLVIAMGSYGGREMGYSSDADVMFVSRVRPGASERESSDDAAHCIQELRRLLGAHGPDPALVLDADLRPEGKAGPLVRTVAGYATYYERWASTWEFQALTRARAVVGPADLSEEFGALIDPLRWPRDGISATARREIRLMKARVESERLPRGANRRDHLKLGTGGISDVEWTVQLLQLEHGHDEPTLRTPSTLAGLRAAVAAGLLPERSGVALRAAWELGWRLRNAAILWRGRAVEAVPSDWRDADGIGRIVGRAPGDEPTLGEVWRRTGRRARREVDEHFYAIRPEDTQRAPR